MKNSLKFHRKQAGHTLQSLADACSMSKSRMCELEKGGIPSLITAHKLAVVLGVTITHIWPNPFEVIEETIIVRRIKEAS